VRQRLQIYLPVFLMALMIQIIAPIGVSWAAASRFSDPLAGAVICHPASGQADGPSDQTGHHAHDGACALCCLAHASAFLDTPKSAVAALHRSFSPVVWHDVAWEFRSSGIRKHARARAPPFNS